MIMLGAPKLVTLRTGRIKETRRNIFTVKYTRIKTESRRWCFCILQNVSKTSKRVQVNDTAYIFFLGLTGKCFCICTKLEKTWSHSVRQKKNKIKYNHQNERKTKHIITLQTSHQLRPNTHNASPQRCYHCPERAETGRGEHPLPPPAPAAVPPSSALPWPPCDDLTVSSVVGSYKPEWLAADAPAIGLSDAPLLLLE